MKIDEFDDEIWRNLMKLDKIKSARCLVGKGLWTPRFVSGADKERMLFNCCNWKVGNPKAFQCKTFSESEHRRYLEHRRWSSVIIELQL